MKTRIFIRAIVALSLCLYLSAGQFASAAWASGPRGAAPAAAYKGGAEPAPASTNILRFLRASAPQPAGLAEGQSATLMPDGRWLLLGGKDGDAPTTKAFLKDERTGQTVALPAALQHARAWHTATVLPDGTVFVLGGVGDGGQLVRVAELFRPETQAFESLPDTGLAARARHTATLLTEGLLLVAGGTSEKGETLGSAELWDPKARAAQKVPARLQNSRSGHSATLQPDGTVLLWGGAGAQGTALDDGELYEPSGKRFSWVGAFNKYEDENAPYLRASVPADGATDAPVDSAVALRFSKPLRVSTVGARTFKLSGPRGDVEASVTPAEGGMLVFLTPHERLDEGATYTVTLSDAADERGRALGFTMLSFTTEGRREESDPASDGEGWVPDARNMRGDWRSNRAESPWQKMPPLEAEPGVTALAGQVLLLNGNPLPGVTLSVGARSATTDHTGRFLLTGLTGGHHVLTLDGRSASRPKKTYGFFKIGVDIEENKTNVLPFTSWMPRLDTEHVTALSVPTASEVAVTTPFIPGLEVRVPQGAIVRDTEGRMVTQLSITPIPVDRTPFPLPQGVNVPVFFTVQPGASRVIPPRARVLYPNYGNDRPGTRMNFWNYDPEGKGWYVYGQGTVTADGRQVVPDAGVVIYEFTGFMFNRNGMPPPPGTGPGAGADAADGDPVDLATGLLQVENTDLALPDAIPLALRRVYRQKDTASRAFGIGASHPYDLYIYSEQEYVVADLILPNGGRVHYVRISPGTSFIDAEFEHTGSDSGFYKSRLKWNTTINSWELTLKNGLTYVFGEDGPLYRIRDRNGNEVRIDRADTNNFGSPVGNITRITSPNGRWISFVYDTSNRITQAKDNLGRTVNYTYDTGGRLWKVTDPKSNVVEYTYDIAHRMRTVKDARGIVYLTNDYDAAGRIFKQTQADNSTYQFAYTADASGKISRTDVTDPRGNVRRVTFNADGHVLTDTRALGKPEEQTYTYERQAGTNLPLATVDSLNRRTTFGYDSLGNVTEVTRLAGTADAVTTRLTYDQRFSSVATITDPLNHVSTFVYDAKGNIVTMRDALNHETTFTYDPSGHLLSATDPLGNTASFRYEAGDLVEVTDPQGQRVTQFLDSAGRLLQLTNPLGQSIRYEYDPTNRPVKVTDQAGNATLLSYDANGNLRTVTDARNGVTTYAYNNMDRLESRTDQLNRTESFVYDAAGNLTQSTDRRGRVTTYGFDNLNRRSFIGYGTAGTPGAQTYESTATFTYDAGHRLRRVVDSAAGTVDFDYDPINRLLSKTTPQGSISYTYDAADRRTGMTVAGQSAVTYTYDDANRITGIAQGSSSVGFTYDDANRRKTTTLPNGVVVEYAYDAGSRLTGITYKKGASVLGNLTYERDALGNRTKVGGSFARVSPAPAVASSAYDAANRLTQRNAATLTYDNNGNLTSDGTNTYTWNSRNQLEAISGAVTASFSYDTFGRRTGRTVNGVTTEYLHDGFNVVQEQSGGAPSVNYLVGAIDEVFARTEAGATQTVLSDGLGTTLALLGAAGDIQTEYTYDPFGIPTATGAASNNSTQFTGRENDGTGLYHYRARYYSPALHRFISEDPAGFRGGVNNYAYVGNNPVNWHDPLGLERGNGALDTLQLALDIGGMIPGFGEPLDLINGGISALRGDYLAAGLSLAAAIPIIGNVAGAGKIARRVKKIHNALDSIAAARRTTAIVEAVDEAGNIVHIVASSEPYLTKAQKALLKTGEVAASGPGHAEVTALNYAAEHGLTPVSVAASRPICLGCQQVINEAGAIPVTPLGTK